MGLPFGIDISSYQTSKDGKQKPDFNRINSVCDFVAMRAGISWGYTDKWFAYYWGQTVRPRLAYHVIYPGEDAKRQTDHFLNIVRPGEHDRLVLDMELDHGVGKTRITNMFLTCLQELRASTGRYPIVYSRAGWVNEFLYVNELPGELDWWLAHYRTRLPSPQFTPERESPPTLPKGVSNWLIHQTGERSDGGFVGVASHYVDTDRWHGATADMLAYFGFGEQTPPEPEPEVLFEAKVYEWATPHANLRSEPSTNSRDLKAIPINTTVPVYEVVDGWYKTRYDNVNGFVKSVFLQRLGSPLPPVIIDIPPLWQRYPRWKDILLGNSTWRTLGSDGCAATCFAMILGVTPAEFNARMKAVGGFTGANIYWGMVEEAYPECQYLWAYDCYYIPAPLDKIDEFLAQGITVMAHVDLDKETYEIEQHWVLIKEKRGNDYIANDPWTGDEINFTEKYGEPARNIYRVRVYQK